jgi:flagellar biosynthesis/type III secretory pathway ATPase
MRAEFINLGAYVSGSNPRLDSAIKSRTEILRFLRQGARDVSTVNDTIKRMEALAGMVGAGAA